MPSVQNSSVGWTEVKDEDEVSISLLKFQDEKKSLSRVLVDEEVVFEKEVPSLAGEDYRSCSSTMSLANSWSLLDDDDSDQRLQAEKCRPTDEEAVERKPLELGEKDRETSATLEKPCREDAHDKQAEHVSDSENEEDRKPAAVDRSNLQQQGVHRESGTSNPPVASLPSDNSPSPGQRSVWSVSRPPPLIPPEMQEKLALAQMAGKSPFKKESPIQRATNRNQNHHQGVDPLEYHFQQQSTPQLKQPPERTASSSSHARLQGNEHLSPSRMHSTNSSIPGTASPTDPGQHVRGLSRQCGAHQIQQQGLSRQSGSHHLTTPSLPVRDSCGTTAATTLTGLPNHHAHAAGLVTPSQLEQHEVPDSQLMALYQNSATNGVHHHAVQTTLLHRQLGKPIGRHSSRPSGPPPVVTVGGQTQPRGPWGFMHVIKKPVSPETIRMAEELNARNQRKNQKRQQLQKQVLNAPPSQLHNRQLVQQPPMKQQTSDLSSLDPASLKGENDDLDGSWLGSDDLANDSFRNGQSFKLASKVLQSSRRLSDPRLSSVEERAEGAIPREALERKRHKSIMHREMSSLASADPTAFNQFASEPRGSLPAANSSVALRDARLSMVRGRASQVMQDTAALQSTQTGTVLPCSHLVAKNAVVKMQRSVPKWSRGRTTFPRSVRINNDTLELNNPISTHSSIGWNSASYRSVMDNSAHFITLNEAGTSTQHSGLPNYNPLLASHIEAQGEIVLSGGNQSATNLDAASVVSPPSREQVHMRRMRRASVRGTDSASVTSSRVSVNHSQSRRPSAMARLPSDAASAASSQVSFGNQSRGRAGLSVAAGGTKAGGIPIPKCKDPLRSFIAMKRLQEMEKEHSELWGDILNEQNEIIMELAKKLSLAENQLIVNEQQQRHVEGNFQSKIPCAERSNGKNSRFPRLVEPAPPKDVELYDIEPAVLIATLESERVTHSAPPGRSSEDVDPAILMALLESKNDQRQEPLTRVNSDRELQVALDISKAEAIEDIKKRRANNLFADLGESLTDVELETAAPRASLESDAEIAGTIEVALRLSKQEYEHEMAMRGPPSATPRNIERVPGPGVKQSHESGMGYSLSTHEGGTGTLSSLRGLTVITGSVPDLVMPALEEDESIRCETRRAAGWTSDQGNDEALALAMALSKVDAPVDEFPELSQEESLAYALELSRREPGAQVSHTGTPSASSSARRAQAASPTHPAPASPATYYPYPPTVQYSPPFHYPPYAQPYSSQPLYSQPYQYTYQPYYPYPPPYSTPFQQPYMHSQPFQHPYPPAPHPYPPAPYPQLYMSAPQAYLQPFAEIPSTGMGVGSGLARPTPSSLPQTASPDEDEALQMALAISRGEANGGKPSGAARSVATTAASSLADEESLVIALELSRFDH